jgi:acyl carrier protein
MHTTHDIFTTIKLYCELRGLDITTDTVLQDNDFDSLDLVELSMHLEEHYSISIQDSDAESWTTVDSVIDTVIASLPHVEVSRLDTPPRWMLIKEQVRGTDRQMVADAVGGDVADRFFPDTTTPLHPDFTAIALQDILTEFYAATANFPQWPTDPLHALAVVQEEVGEVQKEVLQMCYEPHKSNREKIKKEAIQMAAMSLRFLLSLDAYAYAPGAQHEQNQ